MPSFLRLFVCCCCLTTVAWSQEKTPAEPPTNNPPAAEPKNESTSLADVPPQTAPPKTDPNKPKYTGNDLRRPRPTVVVPPTPSMPEQAGKPPSDAIVLFDGTHFDHWQSDRKREDDDRPQWKMADGYFEIKPGSGGIRTREKFGSCQIHLEWRTPDVVKGNGQGRGNSGFYINGHPEIQLLDSYENDTYPDGQAAGIYGFLPPLVNASLPPGEWQTYDIIYMAPRFDAKKKMTHKPQYTVLHNGVLVHHAVEVSGNAVECQFALQDHGNPLRFRNIWVRRLRGYDEHPPSVELGKK